MTQILFIISNSKLGIRLCSQPRIDLNLQSNFYDVPTIPYKYLYNTLSKLSTKEHALKTIYMLVSPTWCAKDSVVLLYICGGDVDVGCVQVVQDGTGRCEAVSDVLVLERAYENFVDGGKKNLSKSVVGAVLLVEECGSGVESIAKFGDLGASGVGWYDGYRAGVDGHNKRGYR